MQTWFLALRIGSSAQQGPVPTPLHIDTSVIVWVSAIHNERIERMATWVCWIVRWTRTSAVDSLESFPFNR